MLLQISDTHLHATPESRMRGVVTDETLQRVISKANGDPRCPADFTLATGDLVQDESRAGYQRFRSLLAPLGVPVACIPGNHDDPRRMEEELRAPEFQVGGEVDLGSWCIVVLNTHTPGDDGGRIGKDGLRAPERRVPGRPIVPRERGRAPSHWRGDLSGLQVHGTDPVIALVCDEQDGA